MLTNVVISVIRFYQRYLSPFMGMNCRFYPSCSHYSVQSIKKHGVLKGLWFTFMRLARCHPFHPGGYDPIK